MYRHKLSTEKSMLLLPAMRAVTLGLAFFSTRLIIQNYGVTEFAQYSVIMSLYSVNTLLDLGLGNQLINRLSQVNGNDEFDSILVKRVAFNALSISFILSSIVILLIIFIQVFLNYSLISANINLLIILFFGVVITSGGRIYGKYLLGKQLNYKYGYFDLFTSLLSYSLIICFATNKIALIFIIFAQTSIMGLCGFLMIKRMSFPSNIELLQTKKNRVETFIRDIRESRVMAALQTLNLLIIQLDTYFLSLFCSSKEVAEYAITWRVYSPVYVLTSAYMTPLWAKSAQLYNEGKLAKVRDLLITNIIKSITIGAISLYMIYILRLFVFGLFTDSKLIPSSRMLIVCGFFLTIYLFTLPLALVMNAIANDKINLIITSFSAITNFVITLSILIISNSNLSGLIGSIIALLLCYCIPSILYLQKRLS